MQVKYDNLILIFILVVIVIGVSLAIAQPSQFGHSPQEIGPGTFYGGGDYIFPNGVAFNNADLYTRKKIFTLSRDIGQNAGDYVNIGSFSQTGAGSYIKFYINNHFCGTISSMEFDLYANYYAGSTTDWVELPLKRGQTYTGTAQIFAIDARITSDFANIETRIRNLGGGACASGTVYVEIETNTPGFTPSTDSGTGATVAGMLGYLSFSFPVAPNRWSATTDGLFIKNNGNVGIGTSTPSEALSLAGNMYMDDDDASGKGIMLEDADRPMITRGFDAFTSGVYQDIGRWGLFMEPNTLTFGIPNIATKYFKFRAFNDDSTANDLMTIRYDGNVGIGTTNPGKPLSIQGTGGNSELIELIDSGGSTEWYLNLKDDGLNFVETGVADGRLFLEEGGNVGVGTTTPTAKLDVAGTVLADKYEWGCIDGDVNAKYNNHCYMEFSSPETFANAIIECQKHGAYLVTIGSSGESSFIFNNIGKNLWIGYSDAVSEGTWQWVNGEVPITGENSYYDDWFPGEPNNGQGFGEDCAVLYSVAQWIDIDCSLIRGYLCERDF